MFLETILTELGRFLRKCFSLKYVWRMLIGMQMYQTVIYDDCILQSSNFKSFSHLVAHLCFNTKV